MTLSAGASAVFILYYIHLFLIFNIFLSFYNKFVSF